MKVADVRRKLAPHYDDARAQFVVGYFKSIGSDKFRGIPNPALRKVARELRALGRDVVVELLHSEWHEERLLALLILVDQYTRGDAATRDDIYRVYLDNAAHVDNWDLVDLSAEHIVGAHGKRRDIDRLAKSKSLWERRMAVLATRWFLKRGEYEPALTIAERLLGDKEDLIHKAVGWMLREIGDRDRAVEQAFLDEHAQRMPRTMLRYAIEKFPPELRRAYLARR